MVEENKQAIMNAEKQDRNHKDNTQPENLIVTTKIKYYLSCLTV